ncbi:uncharacterized protein L969DRAFT_53653 [Mixia osmundae IAM 14324]|uniref:Uncharacterized protein n=1 Tax=Mixia osmundae (strain CBS 9802 / IAM 14324 / JCM 22182 / KY 12970) TaxID=764103 RepID=G7DZF9_MIXOS|nr:uncharacterized protein L969DRAFT_53653 [Mixia osmundae IAM 14324]KEI37140.1 hypothetical protein L969DRAFT_53653 [Mixia osmundae IAM 14324]GAA95969.1 hypothetical protein E5Q_02627 [Mixia osmundae IAM 14324]
MGKLEEAAQASSDRLRASEKRVEALKSSIELKIERWSQMNQDYRNLDTQASECTKQLQDELEAMRSNGWDSIAAHRREAKEEKDKLDQARQELEAAHSALEQGRRHMQKMSARIASEEAVSSKVSAYSEVLLYTGITVLLLAATAIACVWLGPMARQKLNSSGASAAFHDLHLDNMAFT